MNGPSGGPGGGPGDGPSDGRSGGPAEGERGWSLSARAAGGQVRLELGLPDLGGQPVTAILNLDRAEARAFARALLAAAGDATERSFGTARAD